MAGFREFLTGEVLTAANVNDFLMKQSVMVFADGAARDSALGTAIASGNALVEGMLTYNKDTEALEVYDGTAWGSVVTTKEKRIEAFTGSGTWTVPAGVTYAIAHMYGGGGGSGQETSAGTGGTSSVAFASGTVSAIGSGGTIATTDSGSATFTRAGGANLGENAQFAREGDSVSRSSMSSGGGAKAQTIVAGAAVTPAASITVTVGAGGTAGTKGSAGGSGYVYIEYYEEV